MEQIRDSLILRPGRPGLLEITSALTEWLGRQPLSTGLLTLFLRHTSASLLIQENADPDVLRDLEDYFRTIAPEDQGRYRHGAEGPDDMPAHLRTALTQVHLAIPVSDRRLMLGTWQGVYLFEHRRHPGRREILIHLLGERSG